MALMAYAGPAEEGERVLAPFRALATPLADMVQPMAYTGMFEPDDFHPIASGRSLFVEHVDESAAEMVLELVETSTAMLTGVQFRVLGGAVARVADDATAYAHRGRRIMANVAAMYQSLDEAAEHDAWIAKLASDLDQGVPGVYVNFLGDEGPDRVREAYPGSTWEQLVAVKCRYDPANLFRGNHNIPVD